MDPKLVTFFHAESRNEALQAMVQVVNKAGKIHNKEDFLNAILDREEIVSTGIGMGVAIPHAKLANYNFFFISIGILEKGLDWNAMDGAPVRIIFLIGGPDDKQTEYLQILSGLTVAVKDAEIRKKILTLNSSEDMIKLFEDIEIS